MAIFKNQIEDLAGTIPATADGEQFLKDGITDVVHRIKMLYPEHLPLFAKEESISDSGTTVHDTDVLEVERSNKTCRLIPGSGRHAAVDSASLHYATADDPVYYFLNEKIYVRPTGGSPTCSIVAHGAVTNWDSSSSSISYMPDENYFQVVMYAALQVLHHKMVTHTLPDDLSLETYPSLSVSSDLPTPPVAPPLVSFSSFSSLSSLSITATPPVAPVLTTFSIPSITTVTLGSFTTPPAYSAPTIATPAFTDGTPDDLTDMLDADQGGWGDSLDWDFDGENIDFATWFQAAGAMIQNQEDFELASMQLQKIAAYVNAYSTSMQNRLNQFNDANVEYQASIQKAIQNAQIEAQKAQGEANLLLQKEAQEYGSKLTKYQAEIGQYQQEVNAEVAEYTQNLARTIQSWSTEQQNQLALYGANLQKYQAELGANQQEIGRIVGEYTQNLQNVAQKNGSAIQDWGARLGKSSTEYQWLAGQYATVKGQYEQSFLSGHTQGGRQ